MSSLHFGLDVFCLIEAKTWKIGDATCHAKILRHLCMRSRRQILEFWLRIGRKHQAHNTKTTAICWSNNVLILCTAHMPVCLWWVCRVYCSLRGWKDTTASLGGRVGVGWGVIPVGYTIRPSQLHFTLHTAPRIIATCIMPHGLPVNRRWGEDFPILPFFPHKVKYVRANDSN
jgi:hypothetical protein